MLKEAIAKAVTAGGTPVDVEHFIARLLICGGCDKRGTVSVMGNEYNGCTVCGCPFQTKAAMKAADSPLLKVTGALGITDDEIRCPHPDGDKWHEVDELFQ